MPRNLRMRLMWILVIALNVAPCWSCSVCVAPSSAIAINRHWRAKCGIIQIMDRIISRQRRPIIIASTSIYLAFALRRRNFGYLLAENSNDDEKSSTINEQGEAAGDKSEGKPMSAAMVGTIGVYKNWISPLLPPACRFLPTCSQYGVQAIEKFGPNKGVLLIAWRLMRCSPFGGKGYDPPRWPPVAFTYSSY